MVKKRKEVSGPLSKRCAPMSPRPSRFTLGGSPAPEKDQPRDFQEAAYELRIHQLKAIALLLKHYKIQHADMEVYEWLLALVLHLARDQFSYFQEPRGAKRADTLANIRLMRELAAERKSTDRGALSALKRMTALHPNEEVLRKRHLRARKDPWVKLWLASSPSMRKEIEDELCELMGQTKRT